MVSPAERRTVFFLASTLVLGGAEKVARSLALGLGEHGFSPEVLCLHGPGRIGEDLARSGVPLRSALMRTRRDPTVYVRLRGIFRGAERSVLYALDHHDALFWGALASGGTGVRSRVAPVHSTGLWGRRGSFSRTDRWVLPRYDRIIALSEAHAGFIARDGGVDRSRIAVIPNGIDAERFRPAASAGERDAIRRSLGIVAEEFVVAIVASLRPEKNHALFLEAAALVRRGCGGGTFLVVGDGEEAGKLHRMAEELSLGETVRFMGARDDVPAVLAASDAAVLCSHPVVETFPLSVLEAMAAGLPVVVTRVGSIPEMVTDGVEGFVVPPGAAAELAESLLILERDPARRAAMGRRGRETVLARFTERRMVASTAGLLDELVAGAEKGRR